MPPAAQAALFGADHERAETAVFEPIHRFRALVEARTTSAMRIAQQTSDWFNLIARIMLGLTAAVFLAVLYFVLRRRVAIPLARMTGIVARLARQDYAVDVPNDRRRDEIGDMNQAIRVFRTNGMERDRLDAERMADQRVKDSILAMMHRLQACASEAELAEVVACFAPQIFPDLAGHLYVLDDARTTLSPAASWLDPADPGAAFAPAACWGLRRGRPHVSNRDHSDIACPHLGERSVPSLCVPLSAQGEAVGLLYFEERAVADGADQVGGTPRLYLALMAENIGLALANLRLRERLTSLAIRDALTGLLNRRSLDEALNRQARLAAEPLACLMIDIDHFKRFNDHFGHDAGDAVMQHVAQVLRDTIADCGTGGTAYRFGGEEFTVLLPGRDEAGAGDCAERIRARVANTPLSHRGRILGHITVSIGVAASPGDGPVATLVSRADAALLQAKADGRDRVIAATEAGSREGRAA
ncbi:MAG: diguanylate cyclase [Sphingomonas sp.]